MPYTKSARKMVRLMGRQRSRNKPITSAVKTYIAKAERLIIAQESDPAWEAVRQALKALDKAAQKGVIHLNNAARSKSRLMKRFNTTFPPAQQE